MILFDIFKGRTSISFEAATPGASAAAVARRYDLNANLLFNWKRRYGTTDTILRSLIDRVVLMPVNGKLMAQIEGDLAGILGFMSLERKSTVSQGDGALQLELVAGARKQRESLILPVRL